MSKKTYPLLTKDFNDISFDILENGFLAVEKDWSYPATNSPYHRMYFFIDGEVEVKNEAESIRLMPSVVYLIPANVTYDYQCLSTMQKFYIHFELQVLPGVDMFKELNQILMLPYDPMVLDLIRIYASDPSLCGLLHLKGILYEYMAKFLTHAMALPAFSVQYHHYYRQRNVLAYIDANLTTRLKVEEIADALRVSQSVLTRSFKQDIGIGIKRYIELQILKKSKYMLLDQTKTIAEIADTFAFCDAYYFSRFFKKFEQIPPREYRKRLL